LESKQPVDSQPTDCLIVPAVAQARKNMGLPGTHKTTRLSLPTPSLPTIPTRHPRGNDDDIRMPLEIYPECDLKTEVEHPLTKETVVDMLSLAERTGRRGTMGEPPPKRCCCASKGKRLARQNPSSWCIMQSVGMSGRNMGNWCRTSKGFEPTAGYTNFRVCHRRELY
jgi:hypothetical protein